jgi:hypothetical protein
VHRDSNADVNDEVARRACPRAYDAPIVAALLRAEPEALREADLHDGQEEMAQVGRRARNQHGVLHVREAELPEVLGRVVVK